MALSFAGAVLDPSGQENARRRLQRWAAKLGQDPNGTIAMGDAAVGAWGDRAGVRKTETFAAAWVHGPPGAGSIDWRGRNASSFGALAVASATGLELSRGPFGGRPFYYMTQAEGVVLACSQLAPLVGEAGSVSLDKDVLAARILTTPAHDPRATCYREIRRVLPCETLHFEKRTHRTFFTLPAVPSIHAASPDDLAEGLGRELDRAVDSAVGHSSRVSVLAGGGVDSSGLLATVLRRTQALGTAGVIVVAHDFAGPGDDRPHLKALCSFLAVDALRVKPADAGSLVNDAFTLDAAPSEWPTGPLELRAVEHACARGADVVFTGAGGDLVLDGDPGRFEERVWEGDLCAVVDAARFAEPRGLTPTGRLMQFVLRPMLRRAAPAFLLRRHVGRTVRAVAAWTWGGERVRAFLESESPFGPTNREFSSLATSPLLADLADIRGQLETRFGCDQLDPYLDASFLGFMASVPPDALFHGHRSRGLFRHAMRGSLPESVRLRQDKASFEPAIDELVAGMGGRAALESLLTMEVTADLGLINPRAFQSAFVAQLRGDASRYGWIDLWPAVAVEAFARGFRDAVPRSVRHTEHGP